MPLNPPPTIDNKLALIVQPLLRTDMTRPALLTFALSIPGTPGIGVAQTTVDDFQTIFNNRFTAILDNEVEALQPTCRLGDGSTTPFEAVASGAIGTGGSTASTLPPQNAVLLKKNTGVGGKKNRGRTYLPFFVDAAHVSESGKLDSTAITAAQTACNNFLSDLHSGPGDLVIANKVFNVPLPPHHVTAINTGPAVTSYVVEVLLATQRRRIRS